MEFPTAESKNVYWGREQHLVPDRKAIVNPKTNECYAIVSDRYQLLPYDNLFNATHEVLSDTDWGPFTEKYDILSGGRRAIGVFSFPETKFDVDGAGDVAPTVIVKGSYDMTWPVSIDFGGYRFVCSNGLVVGQSFVHYRKKHTVGLDMEAMKWTIRNGMDEFVRVVDTWRAWKALTTSPEQYEYIMTHMYLADKHQEAIHEEIEVSSGIRLDDIKVKTLTYWMFYNIITQYITHKVTSTAMRADLQFRSGQLFY